MARLMHTDFHRGVEPRVPAIALAPASRDPSRIPESFPRARPAVRAMPYGRAAAPVALVGGVQQSTAGAAVTGAGGRRWAFARYRRQPPHDMSCEIARHVPARTLHPRYPWRAADARRSCSSRARSSFAAALLVPAVTEKPNRVVTFIGLVCFVSRPDTTRRERFP